MTPENQQIAIAEAHGWEKHKRPICDDLGPIGDDVEICWFHPTLLPEFTRAQRSWAWPSKPPNYLKDYNAIHKVITDFSLDAQCEITETLRRDVLKFKAPTITASAAQLSEAVLRYLNLWIETPA